MNVLLPTSVPCATPQYYESTTLLGAKERVERAGGGGGDLADDGVATERGGAGELDALLLVNVAAEVLVRRGPHKVAIRHHRVSPPG
jgi:hypothetical protein